MLWMILPSRPAWGWSFSCTNWAISWRPKPAASRCEKFYVGFDIPMGPLPASLLKFRWGETEYGIGILPLGGYVKMLGQDDNPQQPSEGERTDQGPQDVAGGGAELSERRRIGRGLRNSPAGSRAVIRPSRSGSG